MLSAYADVIVLINSQKEVDVLIELNASFNTVCSKGELEKTEAFAVGGWCNFSQFFLNTYNGIRMV